MLIQSCIIIGRNFVCVQQRWTPHVCDNDNVDRGSGEGVRNNLSVKGRLRSKIISSAPICLLRHCTVAHSIFRIPTHDVSLQSRTNCCTATPTRVAQKNTYQVCNNKRNQTHTEGTKRPAPEHTCFESSPQKLQITFARRQHGKKT